MNDRQAAIQENRDIISAVYARARREGTPMIPDGSKRTLMIPRPLTTSERRTVEPAAHEIHRIQEETLK